ncbi:bifunctional pyr operon transcriptional regulator/uracil phosphoribosyltransferase PyrR [Aromatoleum evansii]|uniref:Bifunctional pyr operon transcriptional regulator/uracil phosphoribosyltransferase PyrR n=1 Tax=Aromatoleum evansii TaxID=59406 RepID=A0ABZ1AKF7_AROEV|nr:bifunctional pyr operon transcriptional regulator/uracil phosphoribosyltransferase PyrR [Aromatoleum evansii]NMG29199.1 bifunctional pyr operon transcriptional regulator/uracil phosphoribosyltransferase PyrR [Aromatoleum evansii]WRL45759.1 bifunctional pyr operon transcriptional regulator/uracil phosphoribosyltransferase PyrR [Aromatoleum evansii]
MQKLDAEALFQTLVEQMRPHVTPDTALVGIHTGGVWLAERLHQALGLKHPTGSIDVSFYRDDFGSKGLHPQPKRTEIPFDVEAAHVIIVDDVLYTGRTTRAAINELFDFGRPARVDLAVLVDRGGRELPIAARYCALTLPQPLPASQNLQLETDAAGALTLRLIDA